MNPYLIAGKLAIAGGKYVANSGLLGEITPAAKAQRQVFLKARDNMRTGEFGLSNAEKNEQFAQYKDMAGGVERQMAADASRGGVNPAQAQALAQAKLSADAQAAGQIQQASNQVAQARYQNAQATIDAQADRKRKLFQSKQFTTANDKLGEDVTSAFGGAENQEAMFAKLMPKKQ